jgi:hypothetical protein
VLPNIAGKARKNAWRGFVAVTGSGDQIASSGIDAIGQLRTAQTAPRVRRTARRGEARGYQMQHVDFILIWLACVALALPVTTLVLIHRQSLPSIHPMDVLPDFAIFDCGASIHLVPLEPDYHQVDNSGRCRCGPAISNNQRRFGTSVRYVDHRSAAWRQSVSPTVTRDRRETSQ